MNKSEPSRILIVDDSEDVRSIVKTFLEHDATFAVCGEAGSGAEAVQKARELRPDLVLLDLKLPGMNGIEAATILKGVLPEAKLVLFSAYAESTGNHAWASSAGIDLVLSKGSLVDMVQSLKTLTRGRNKVLG